MMQKILRTTCVASLALILLAGCSFAPNRKETSYYNGYLGLTVTVPVGWYVDSRNETNLTESAEESFDLHSLDLYDFGDGGYEISLISLQNRQDSTDDNHAEFTLYAEYYPDIPTDEYYEMFSAFVLDMSDDMYTYQLIDRGSQKVNGRSFTRFLFEVTFSDGTVPYYEEYYVTPVKEAYVVAYINYWSDSNISKAEALDALNKCFELSGVSSPQVTPPAGDGGDKVQAA